ncbi:hypothetical protein [Natrinema sp. DC36]|uniref:hypothetical protein n=1 Tax=Natrinema sp. DC36 TaxID=2878680 RepID=UPI001CF046A5|nr:hypothetical protein [Natrinema sp. DC36]
MTEIPDWIEEKISFDKTRDVQDSHIVEVFLESDRPYLSNRKVASEIGLTKQGTTPRLEELVDIDILDGDSAAGGRIFWIHDDRSEWPIPPDVEVEPVQEEMTVNEYFNQLHVKYGLLAIGGTMIGALLMMAFTLFVGYEIQMPLINASGLLLGGVIFTVLGYSFVFLALGFGAWDRFSSQNI